MACVGGRQMNMENRFCFSRHRRRRPCATHWKTFISSTSQDYTLISPGRKKYKTFPACVLFTLQDFVAFLFLSNDAFEARASVKVGKLFWNSLMIFQLSTFRPAVMWAAMKSVHFGRMKDGENGCQSMTWKISSLFALFHAGVGRRRRLLDYWEILLLQIFTLFTLKHFLRRNSEFSADFTVFISLPLKHHVSFAF